MKKVITILILILIAKISPAQYNWVKIYDSPYYGIKNFYSEKINFSNQKILYLMLGLNFNNPNESGRIYRLNKTNGNWVIPANGFFNPYWCYGAVPPNPPTYHCNYVSQFRVSPIDTQFILKNSEVFCGGYDGGNSFFVTYNSGLDTSFIPGFSNGFLSQICTGFDINPVNDSIIYVLYPSLGYSTPAVTKIRKSTNRGLSWFITDSTSVQASQLSFVRINPIKPNYIYAFGYGNGMSTNSGYNFFETNAPELRGMYFDMVNGSVYGLGAYDSTIYKSTNDGLNWSLLYKFNERLASFEISPDNHNILYAGGLSGLYRSTNTGLSWSLYNNSFSPSKSVIGLSKDPGTGETLYVSTTDAVYKVWGQYIQTNDTSSLQFMPLAIGNTWVYQYDISWPPPFGNHYIYKTTITKDTLINGKRYFYCGLPLGGEPNSWVRVDTSTSLFLGYNSSFSCALRPNEFTIDSLASKIADSIRICIQDYMPHRICVDTLSFSGGPFSGPAKGFNSNLITNTYRKYVKGIGLHSANYGEISPSAYTLRGCVINGIVYGDTSMYYNITGYVLYSDNNQPVTSGYVKALMYDWVLDKVITIDSARINTSGYYSLPHCPQDSLDIMAYGDDGLQDFVPTYYDSTIYWQNSITLYPTSNINNVNIKVHRAIQPERSYNFVSGGVYRAMMIPNDALKDAMVYAKFNNEFVSCGTSIANGYYIVDSLPSGKCEIIVDRMGYYSDYRSLPVGEILLDTINFFLTRVVGSNKQISSLPTSFMLFQNYPNPFNPLTTLNFDVPPMHNNNPPAHPGGKGVLVKLVVYDILGREVAMLVNEELSAGSYRIVWDASNYASGLYFYKLITDEFTQTRKMVLIK